MATLVDMLKQDVQPDFEPDDLVAYAKDAAALSNIRDAYQEALEQQEAAERANDARCRYLFVFEWCTENMTVIAATKEYIELHDHVESSTTLLDSLESFLSTFQHDLSAVSGHISELQARSRSIEARLQGRKALESSLNPMLSQLIIPPELIDLILDTNPSDAWLPAISDLELRLTAIRSGPRVPARQNLDFAAEKLRIKASDKLRQFFFDRITPYRTSIAVDSHKLHDILTKHRLFYSFLQRHSPRQAHEVQKSYIAALAWYYETGFRRYTRALERIQLRSVGRDENTPGTQVTDAASLASMIARNVSSLSLTQAQTKPMDDSETVLHSRIDGPPVLVGADMTANTTATPEALFRSISLVLADNAEFEFAFINRFFSKPGDAVPPLENASDRSWDVLSHNDSFASGVNGSVLEDLSTVDDTASVITLSEAPGGLREKRERTKRPVVESVWKQLMVPVLEYCKSFVTGLLDPVPNALAVLAMIRLNDAIYRRLIDDAGCLVPEMENYLIGVRLQLWPLFNKDLNAQIDAVKKLAASASGTAGLFASKAGVKDAVVQKASVVKRYISLFSGVTQLSTEEDEETVYSNILRLRVELEKLLLAQSQRIADKQQAAAYLSTVYEELLSSASNNLSSSGKSQQEVAHWRELLAKRR